MTTPTNSAIPDPELPVDRDAIARAIEELAAVIGGARSRADAGDPIDLTGLDRRVRTLCAAVAALESGAARALVPQLVGLTGALDALEGQLRRRNRPTGDPVRRRPAEPAQAPARAAEAYRAATGREL